MGETKPEPKAGDPCPQCGDSFVEHRAPTDAERRAAEDREQARPYPARVDSASAGVREALGPLFECRGCGYKTRVRPDADADADAAAASSSGRSRRRATNNE